MDQISRYGAYGVLLQEAKVLLTLKKSGPYLGLWDLPGGGIEFGETPKEALERELLEETALAAEQIELLTVATAFAEYEKANTRYQFHHIGIIYKVSGLTLRPDLVPEEECCWMTLKDLIKEELTPLAKYALLEDGLLGSN